jgi:hypothetical protein
MNRLNSMLLRHDVESLDQVGCDAPMNAAGATVQSRMLVPPFGVVSLGNACLSAPFLAGLVLIFPEETSISRPEVRRDWLVSVVFGNVTPGKLKHFISSSSDGKAKNVLDKSRDRYPEPQRGSDADAKLVELDGIVLGGENPWKSFSLYPCSIFFRMARTVPRPTLNVAAIPTWEIPWARARTMASSFSGVRERERGLRVKHLLQLLQRHRFVWVLQLFPK